MTSFEKKLLAAKERRDMGLDPDYEPVPNKVEIAIFSVLLIFIAVCLGGTLWFANLPR